LRLHSMTFLNDFRCNRHQISREISLFCKPAENPTHMPKGPVSIWGSLVEPRGINRRERLGQQPSTWGRPDVDTYRDLVFWIEGDNVE
jgi:hypothetical protein